jgi:preprotein translocase subunit SecE
MSGEKKSKSSFFSDFYKGLKIEFKKISWPDKAVLGKQTIAVTIVTVVVGIIIALIDTVIKYGVDWLTM